MRWRAVEAAIGVLGAALLLSLAFGFPLPGATAALTGASLGIWGLAAALEHLPIGGGTSDVRVLIEAAVVAVILAGFPAAARAPTRWRWLPHVGALPGLVGLIAALLFGLGLGGWLAGGVLIALALPAVGGGPALPGPPRHLALVAAMFAGWVAFLELHALYVSGPGIQPAPVADRGIWGGLQDLLSALPAGGWFEAVGSIVGVLAALLGSRGLLRAGVPRWPRLLEGPSQWLVAGAHLAIVVGLCSLGPWVSGVWRCPEPAAFVRPFDAAPGTFQLAVVGEQLWANDREARQTRRFALPAGAPLPPLSWEAIVPDAWPEELVPVDGGAWVALVVGEESGSVLVGLDDDGQPGSPLRLPGCFVASQARLPGGDLLLGCEYAPDFLRLDPQRGEIVDRFVVPGLGSVEELVVVGQSAYAVALWGAPWLVEVDLARRAAVRSHFAGDFNWGLAHAPGSDLLAVPRFLERRIDLYDRATLAPRGHLPGEFGGRPIVFDAPRQAWYVAGTFSGRLRRSSLDGETRTLPVGGLVRTLALHGDTLYLGGRCGVRAVDLEAWDQAP